MKYRDSHDIRAAILGACDLQVGTKFTKVMYKSFVSYVQMRNLVHRFEKTGLLRIEKDQLFLTPKGKQVLDIIRELKELVKID